MKRMCAWCGKELDRVEHRDQQPLTHGLCPACRKRYFSPAKERSAAAVESSKSKGSGEKEEMLYP